jgi:hypothetical protein
VKRETSGNLIEKEEIYIKTKSLTWKQNKNVRYVYAGVNEFNKGYLPTVLYNFGCRE